MFDAPKSRWRVPYDGEFRVEDARTKPPKRAPSGKECKERLEDLRDRLRELQRVLYADDRFASSWSSRPWTPPARTARSAPSCRGVNPAGCQVFSFKQPSAEELDHDFLWRTARGLPERGRIGVFNRSYYEEVLVVRVHPEFLDGQRLPDRPEARRRSGRSATDRSATTSSTSPATAP